MSTDTSLANDHLVDPDCIFCKLANHAIPARAVFEDDDIFAFEDLSPQATVHILIVPKRHIANLAATSDGDLEVLGKLLRAAAVIAADQGVSESGYRTVANVGRDGGQTVDHLHLHLLGGRHMGWPPG